MADKNGGYIGNSPSDSSVTIARQAYTSSGITTDFTFRSGYTPGYLDAYLNGVRLIETDDYVATDGTTLSLTTAAQNGDTLELIAYKAFNISNITFETELGGNFDVSNNLIVGGNLDVDGTTELDVLNVAETATFTGAIDANGNLDVDGYTELDDLNVSGVTTTGGLLDINAGAQANTLKVEDLTDNRVVIAGTGGELEDDANFTFDGTQLALGVGLTVTGVSTFASAVDINSSIDVDGHTELDDLNVSGVATVASAKISDLNSGRVVIAGTDGELEDSANLTFDGSTLSVGGNISVGGTLTYEDVTNVDSIGIVTAREGIKVLNSGGVQVATGATINGETNTITALTNGSEALRIDSNKRLLVNKTASTTSNGHSILQVASTSNDRAIAVHNFEDDANGPFISLGKSRGTSLNTYTIVQNGDELGNIDFFGADGTDFSTVGARIQAEVDGPVGVNSLPSRLIFATTSEGENNATERLRISSSGQTIVKGVDDQDNFIVDASLTQFVIHQDSTDGEISLRAQDGSGNNYAKYMTFFVEGGSGPTEKLRITSDGKVRVPDNGKFVAGAGDDLQIWSDNTDQYIRGEQNQLLIRSNNLRLQSYLGENYIHAANNNAVSLYYDNSKKLETTTTGATITSDLILDHASGDKAIRWATGGTNKWSLYHNNGAGALVAYDNANNAERLRINANGTATFNNAVLIGGVTTNNGFKLKVSDGGGYEFAFGPNDSGINSLVSYDRSGSAYVDCRIIQKELQLWSGTGPVERLRITSGGKVLAGNYFTSQQIGYYESSIQIQGTDSHTASMSIFRYSNDNGGSNLTLGKGRGTSGGDVDKPQNGDALGALRWVMANNNNLTDGESAKIECNVDNIPGGGDYPSRLTFWTASDGANSVTERLRITSGGEIKIPGSSGSMLTINEGSPSGNFYQEIAYAPGGKGCLYLENFAYYAGQPALVVNDQDTNNQRVMEDVQFQRNGTLRGYIRINPGSVTYSTSSSDIRTKKNFEDWTEDNLSKFKTLSPKLFNWIEEDDGSEKTKGFIAQDNLEKFPEAYPLTASTDRYAFNPSGMVAYLMKALQEAALKIETLEGRMDDAGL